MSLLEVINWHGKVGLWRREKNTGLNPLDGALNLNKFVNSILLQLIRPNTSVHHDNSRSWCIYVLR